VTTKNEALTTRPMAEGLVRTARTLDTYLEALRDACLNPALTLDAKEDIKGAAQHLLDAQHKLLRAAKKLTI
jgi:hypothetical protein